jgi:hypothetical protein
MPSIWLSPDLGSQGGLVSEDPYERRRKLLK